MLRAGYLFHELTSFLSSSDDQKRELLQIFARTDAKGLNSTLTSSGALNFGDVLGDAASFLGSFLKR